MKIKSLVATNVHGLNIGLDLKSVNVICGDNFTGKTAIMKSIRLGLTGYLPLPIGKTPGSIYKLAGNPEGEGSMSIEMLTDNGRAIKHKWSRDAKGKTSAEGGVPMDLQMPPLLCEPRTFFGMTGADRIKIVFAACDVTKSGFGAKMLNEKLGTVQVQPVKVCETTLNTIAQYIDAQFADGATIQDATDRLLKWLKQNQADSRLKAETASGSFAAFRTKTATGRPVDKTAEIEKLQRVIQGLGENNAVERNRLFLAVESAKNQLTESFTILDNFETVADEKLKALDNSIKNTKKAFDAEQAKPQADVGPFETRLEKLEQERDKHNDIAASAESSIEAEQTLIKSTAKLKLCDKCKKALATASKKAIEKFGDEHKLAIKKHAEAISAIEKLSVEIEQLKQANSKHDANITTLETQLQEQEQDRNLLTKLIGNYRTAVKAFKALPETVDNSVKTAELNELKTQQSAFNVYQNDIKRRDDLERELLEHQCEEAVYKSVTKIVLEEQEKVMTFAFNEVLAVARHFTDGLLNSPLEFYNGELGRRVSALDKGTTAAIGSWISHETLSTTETMLAYAGFSIALAQQAPMKIIFMDELAAIKSDLLVKVIERMCDLVHKGVIDQFIGTMPETQIEASHLPEVQIIKLQ